MSMKKFVKIFFDSFLFKVSYSGLDNLQKYDQYLICPNHSCIFDPFFIYPPSRNLFIMAKAEIFKYPIFSRIIKHYNVFPVDRTKVDSKSLFQALSIFENNEPNQLLIFPEGKVVKDENEIGKKARNGATFIAAKVNIPIIPTYITRRPSFFSKVNVTFGEPIFIPQEVLNDKNILRDYSRKLVDKIYSLKNWLVIEHQYIILTYYKVRLEI